MGCLLVIRRAAVVRMGPFISQRRRTILSAFLRTDNMAQNMEFGCEGDKLIEVPGRSTDEMRNSGNERIQ